MDFGLFDKLKSILPTMSKGKQGVSRAISSKERAKRKEANELASTQRKLQAKQRKKKKSPKGAAAQKIAKQRNRAEIKRAKRREERIKNKRRR